MGGSSLLMNTTTIVRVPVNGGINFGNALGWGLLSALSLVIGAAIGVTSAPSPKVNAAMMAFGGGALIQALSIELFGAILQHQADTGIGCTLAAIAAAVAGGAFFSFLDKVLNDQGAFFRKKSTLKVAKILGKVQPDMESGELKKPEKPDPNAVEAYDEAEAERIRKAEAARAKFRAGITTVASSTKIVTKLEENRREAVERRAEEAAAAAAAASHQGHQGGKNAAIMIWLGIGLDAIPESFVLGILANSGNISSLITFTVGVFLANLPEAMSSAAIMKSYSMKSSVIMGMWTAIFLGTGLGAGLGAICFPPLGPDEQRTLGASYLIAIIEGVCGGAMLTMIASTVLPEAFEIGGSMVGYVCLLGFLSALLVKSIGEEVNNEDIGSSH